LDLSASKPTSTAKPAPAPAPAPAPVAEAPTPAPKPAPAPAPKPKPKPKPVPVAKAPAPKPAPVVPAPAPVRVNKVDVSASAKVAATKVAVPELKPAPSPAPATAASVANAVEAFRLSGEKATVAGTAPVVAAAASYAGVSKGTIEKKFKFTDAVKRVKSGKMRKRDFVASRVRRLADKVYPGSKCETINECELELEGADPWLVKMAEDGEF